MNNNNRFFSSAWFAAALWTLVLAGSLGWALLSNRQQTLDLARHEAKAYLGKDIAFRSWATSHGGVYVPPSERTPPNPYLANVPDRDVETTSGKKLTLMNPAYMLREVQTYFGSGFGEKGHITSLKPLNPGNAPDAWERSVLRRFERGEREIWEISEVDGKPHLRMMRAFIIEKGCLKCHAQQGYTLGDVRGGIAVTLSLDPFTRAAEVTRRDLSIGHGSIWLLGLAGIGFVARLRRRNEADALAAQAARLKASAEIEDLYDHAPCGYHSLDANGVFVRINQTELDWLGYRREDVVGRLRFEDVVSETGIATFRENFPRFMREGYVSGLEFDLRCKDGSLRPVIVSATAVRDEAGAFLMSRSTMYDISERKQVEREREQYFSFFMLSTNPMCIADPFGCFLKVNPALTQLTGFEASELVAKPFLEFVVPEDRQRTVEEMEKQVTVRPSMNFVNRYLRKDGTTILLSWTAYFDKNTGVTYATAHDITESKRAEDEIRKLNAELEQRVAQRTSQLEAANKELEAFAYSVSHDLRAPLRAVDGFSKILSDEYGEKLDADAAHLLAVVRENAQRMGQLIGDILDLSRTNRLEMEKTPVDLAKLAQEIFAEQKTFLPQRAIRLEVGELPVAWGDRSLLRQVLVNLLSNAIKFTAAKAEAVIVLAGYSEGDEDHYSVQDNGAGFDMNYVHKLFGVFERLHTREEFEGTGIGLAIVKRVVVRHGGRVWAEGKVGEGATIHFTLPHAAGAGQP
ncbi:MAG: PAS domain S-box protein [Rhodocyclaceae bacterium]|nr:PAS domain S-box protein [Rhodocyclaceae bacterium]